MLRVAILYDAACRVGVTIFWGHLHFEQLWYLEFCSNQVLCKIHHYHQIQLKLRKLFDLVKKRHRQNPCLVLPQKKVVLDSNFDLNFDFAAFESFVVFCVFLILACVAFEVPLKKWMI